MSLVNLAHCCSHLQNASLARLGLTSVPSTNLHHNLMLQLQKSGYITSVTVGGPTPPPPSSLNPILDPAEPSSKPQTQNEPAITQANISSRRLWVGMKYWNNEPVLHKMGMVSKPTRRVWVGFRDLEALARGDRSGYVKGLRGIGESMYLSTDRGIMEVREAVERKTGGMLLCRVNGV
ncbi:MAG: hypothetical protein Q9208_006569 [Pyrenodesmia sp. 3 TL-2023]